MITQRLIEILDELRGVIKQQELKITNDVLFEQGCSFLRGELAGQNKFKPFYNPSKSESNAENTKGKPVTKESDFSNNSPKKATDKQIAYAQALADDLGCDLNLDKNMSYNELDAVIKSLKEKKWNPKRK